jgi:hypothetical protein
MSDVAVKHENVRRRNSISCTEINYRKSLELREIKYQVVKGKVVPVLN